jgi:hypothetical protein
MTGICVAGGFSGGAAAGAKREHEITAITVTAEKMTFLMGFLLSS